MVKIASKITNSVNIEFRSQILSNGTTISFEIDWNSFKTFKNCDNTRIYYTCKWSHFSGIGSILVSIVTILASIKQANQQYLSLEIGHTMFYVLCKPKIGCLGFSEKWLFSWIQWHKVFKYMYSFWKKNTKYKLFSNLWISWT